MSKINKLAEYVKDPIHENCKGCNKVLEDSTCSAYIKPESWWRRGICPLADHVKIKVDNNASAKTRIGQQKQKKKTRGK